MAKCLLYVAFQTVDVLLKSGVNASQSLTHGVGSALCAATLIANESKRKPEDRIALVSYAYYSYNAKLRLFF